MDTCRSSIIDPFSSCCTKLKYKWIKDLDIKPDSLNFIKEKWEQSRIEDLMNRTPVAQIFRSIINKWQLM